MRAPYQVLVFPFIKQDDAIFYCIFKREDLNVWQGIAGGGEEEDGSPSVSAARESFEEAGIPMDSKIIQLDTVSSIPVVNISGFIWGKNKLIIPEYSFGVEVSSKDISLSHEHLISEWVPYEEAIKRLNWDSNKTALWELNHRLTNSMISI